MLGDDEHPISFRFCAQERGDGPHVVVGVWAGHRASGRGNAGSITLRREEWEVLSHLLESIDLDHVGDASRIIEGIHVDGDPIDVESWA